MILRRLVVHSRGQHWTAYANAFVVGVQLGIALESGLHWPPPHAIAFPTCTKAPTP
jgi:hypothetical protein